VNTWITILGGIVFVGGICIAGLWAGAWSSRRGEEWRARFLGPDQNPAVGWHCLVCGSTSWQQDPDGKYCARCQDWTPGEMVIGVVDPDRQR